MPAAVQVAYGDVDNGPPKVLLACCLISIPPSRWEAEDVWELSRLVRLPDYQQPLTKLISATLNHIRKGRLTDLVVSFADTEEDHHGGIYQACSWIYDGLRDPRLDGFLIDGVFSPARTCNSVYGTSSLELLQSKLPGKTIEPHFDNGKHCYWKPLTKQGMQKAIRLGLRSNPYPKPMLDSSSGDATNYAVDAMRRKGVVKLPPLNQERQRPTYDATDVGDDLGEVEL